MASPEVGVSPRRSDRCAILCAAVLLNVGRGSVVRAVLRGDAGLGDKGAIVVPHPVLASFAVDQAA